MTGLKKRWKSTNGLVRESHVLLHSWERHTGGRIMSAGISASIIPAEQFLLEVKADDVNPDYIAAAENGALTTLLSQSFAPVLGCKLTLFEFCQHVVESSYAAFYYVAEEATKKLLGLADDTENHIEW